MSMTARVVALSTTYLPVEQTRQALLPPVRLMRTSAVAVARTVRHWELLLDGASTGDVNQPSPDEGRPSPPAAGAANRSATGGDCMV